MATPIDPARLALLIRAQAVTALALMPLTPAQRATASPCDGWTVDDVAVHLGGGAVLAADLLAGRSGSSADEARDRWASRASAGDLPSIGAAFALERRAFERTEAAHPVDHPVVPMTADSLLDQRLLEYAVHVWDVHRAVGGGPRSDAAVVEAALAALRPLASIVAVLGVFGDGPSGQLAAGAGPEDELLDLVGRRP